jgi:four helix bundle protein
LLVAGGGKRLALSAAIMAKNIVELLVYQKAVRAGDAISALLKLPGFRNEWKLTDQLGDAADSVQSNISEGFGRSNRVFMQFLDYARGSENEVRAHLATARGRGCITSKTQRVMEQRYEVIGKMLTRLIQHLRRRDEGSTNN